MASLIWMTINISNWIFFNSSSSITYIICISDTVLINKINILLLIQIGTSEPLIPLFYCPKLLASSKSYGPSLYNFYHSPYLLSTCQSQHLGRPSSVFTLGQYLLLENSQKHKHLFVGPNIFQSLENINSLTPHQRLLYMTIDRTSYLFSPPQLCITLDASLFCS